MAQSGFRPDYIRLRQVCLVARDIHRAETLLTTVLGLRVAFRDERVARYGLENFIVPLGTSFIEVVAPIQPDTAAGRFLDRYQERRGYMLLCDCGDLAAVRARVERLGIRVLHSRKWPRYENIQLHPRDTGAVIIEFNHSSGGDDLNGYYEPAGEHWQEQVRDDVAIALLGAELTAPDPTALAQRWSAMFDRPLRRDATDEVEIMLDAGRLRFLPGADGEQLHALDVAVRDVGAVLDSARRLGCAIDGTSIDMCGVWFRLTPA